MSSFITGIKEKATGEIFIPEDWNLIKMQKEVPKHIESFSVFPFLKGAAGVGEGYDFVVLEADVEISKQEMDKAVKTNNIFDLGHIYHKEVTLKNVISNPFELAIQLLDNMDKEEEMDELYYNFFVRTIMGFWSFFIESDELFQGYLKFVQKKAAMDKKYGYPGKTIFTLGDRNKEYLEKVIVHTENLYINMVDRIDSLSISASDLKKVLDSFKRENLLKFHELTYFEYSPLIDGGTFAEDELVSVFSKYDFRERDLFLKNVTPNIVSKENADALFSVIYSHLVELKKIKPVTVSYRDGTTESFSPREEIEHIKRLLPYLTEKSVEMLHNLDEKYVDSFIHPKLKKELIS